jgi:hypothetical protein
MMLKQNNLFVTSFIITMILVSFDAISGCDNVVNECKQVTGYNTVMSVESFKGCHNFVKSNEIEMCSNYNPFDCKNIEVPEPDSSWNSSALSSLYTFTCEKRACVKNDELCFPFIEREPSYDCQEKPDFKLNMQKLGNKKNTIFITFDEDSIKNLSMDKDEEEYYEGWKKNINTLIISMNEHLNCLGIPLNVQFTSDYKTVLAAAKAKDIKALWYKYNSFFIIVNNMGIVAQNNKGFNGGVCDFVYEQTQEGVASRCKIINSNRQADELHTNVGYKRVFGNKTQITQKFKSYAQHARYIAHILVHETTHAIISRALDYMVTGDSEVCGKKARYFEQLAKQVKTMQKMDFTKTHHITSTYMAEGNRDNYMEAAQIITNTKDMKNLCNAQPFYFGFGNNTNIYLKRLVQNFINKRVSSINNQECIKVCTIKNPNKPDTKGNKQLEKVQANELIFRLETLDLDQLLNN